MWLWNKIRLNIESSKKEKQAIYIPSGEIVFQGKFIL
jgi:hypothetical protein